MLVLGCANNKIHERDVSGCHLRRLCCTLLLGPVLFEWLLSYTELMAVKCRAWMPVLLGTHVWMPVLIGTHGFFFRVIALLALVLCFLLSPRSIIAPPSTCRRPKVLGPPCR